MSRPAEHRRPTKPASLHVITSLHAARTARTLTRVIRADFELHGARHIVVALKEDGSGKQALQDAGIELHCLGLATPWHAPGALLRLMVLMRRLRPDVVTTWCQPAHLLAIAAAVASGTGAKRVVWTMSGANPNASGRTRSMPRLLRALSPLPWGIAVGSRSARQAYQALGYRPRRWFGLDRGGREEAMERELRSYRRLWRVASGLDPASVRPGLLERTFPWLKKRTLARIRRMRLTKTTFIAVTGSCGKSMTVRLATDILRGDGSCFCREFQNIVGSSVKTILSIPASSKYCVQEVSGHFPGAIAGHIPFLKPRIGIVTAIGSDHYTEFRGLEATAKEKGGLVEALPGNGIAILNADDPHVRAMASRTHARVLLFGLSPDADIRAHDVSSRWPDRLTLTVVHGDESVRIRTKLAGEHWIPAALAAIACGVACGVGLRACARAVEALDPLFGRYSVHFDPDGPVFVLDTVKAPFWTIAAGLSFIAQAQAPRKTVVFGNIADMPGRGRQKYRKIAREALDAADRVVFVGPNAASATKQSGGELGQRLFAFQTSYQACAFLAESALPAELIYIKASAADHLERLMLSRLDLVVCWRERCGMEDVTCPQCRDYRKPHAPPFGLAEPESDRDAIAAKAPGH